MAEIRKSPTVRRRRLSAELRRLLVSSGLTAIQVDERLGWTGGKFAKMARGQWVRPNPRDIADLLDLFAVEDQHQREEMLRWAREGRERGWWHPYREMISERYTTYIGLEAEAASVLNFELGMMPGLAQTSEYARALLLGGPGELSGDEINQRIEIRRERQKLLTQEHDPLRLWAVLDEAVLRRPIGGSEVMRAQLDHLVELAELPKVTVQVIPYSVGSHPGVGGPFAILEFPEPLDPDVVYVENIAGELLIEEPRDVAKFKVGFQRLGAVALSPADSLSVIAAAAAEV